MIKLSCYMLWNERMKYLILFLLLMFSCNVNAEFEEYYGSLCWI